MRDSYIFYASFYEAIKELDDANRLVIYDAINEYSLTGQLPKLEGIPKAILKLITPQIDANQKRYDNGKKGGRPKILDQNENLFERNFKPGEPVERNIISSEPVERNCEHIESLCEQTQKDSKPKDNLNLTETKPNKNDNVNVNNNPSISPPKGGCKESEKSWKEDYQVYLTQLKEAYTLAVNDQKWMEQREKYHPNLNIKRSLSKAYVDFWGTEAGWMHKKSEKRTKVINWRTTLANALTLRANQVYKDKNE